MDIDFIVQDSFALIRPHWKIITDFEEAGRVFSNLVKQNYKAHEPAQTKGVSAAQDEASSSEEADGEDIPAPEMDDAQVSSDEDDPEVREDPRHRH